MKATIGRKHRRFEWTNPDANSSKISIFHEFWGLIHPPLRHWRDNARGQAKGCEMDVHAAIGDERRLRRIIATLAALAVLAERAALRCHPVRIFVLWLLRRAETVVGEFVFDATGMPPPAIGGVAAVGNASEDALLLAARLRALAAALAVLLAIACRLDRWPRRRGVASGPVAPGSGRRSGGWTRIPNDTS